MRATKPASLPVTSGSKSRLTPSAPRFRTAATIWPARFRRAAGLARRACWTAALLEVHAIASTVRVTRVWLAWAALMIVVIAELVQPAQPVVGVPLLFLVPRLPAASVPTPK